MIKSYESAARIGRAPLVATLFATVLSLAGCNSFSGVGPSAQAIHSVAERPGGSPVYLLDITMETANALRRDMDGTGFVDVLGNAQPVGTIIHAGDALSISIWEAPPAVLFGSSMIGSRSSSEGSSALAQGNSSSTARTSTMPEQVVNSDGMISIPFAGRIPAVGRTTREVEVEITRRLRGKAHLPQVDVSFARNASTTATVVGEFEKSGIIPLTAKGERVLDAIASAGGTKQAINKTTIQLSRGSIVRSLPLETIIHNPQQNVVLAPGDVVTAYYQALSFIALGSTGLNKEIPFESTGITLAEALGRAGGLDETKANPSGAFIFRFEDARVLGIDPANPVRQTASGPVPVKVDPQGRVAVIYQIDLRNAAAFFAAQNFPMRDKDVLYVSQAPITNVQKFVSIISQSLFPIFGIDNTLRR